MCEHAYCRCRPAGDHNGPSVPLEREHQRPQFSPVGLYSSGCSCVATLLFCLHVIGCPIFSLTESGSGSKNLIQADQSQPFLQLFSIAHAILVDHVQHTNQRRVIQACARNLVTLILDLSKSGLKCASLNGINPFAESSFTLIQNKGNKGQSLSNNFMFSGCIFSKSVMSTMMVTKDTYLCWENMHFNPSRHLQRLISIKI